MIPPERSRTVPEIARELVVSEAKISGFIRDGELKAINVARKKSGRPRWRVLEADYQAFLNARSASPAPEPRRKRKRNVETAGAVVEFF